jgi:DNA-3-methyladenine glycosylase
MTTISQFIDFSASSVDVARSLIGATLLVDGVGGRIVETEAYIYRSYGIHWCLNFVCRTDGHGAGVLIRALEPLAGLDIMRTRRGLSNTRLLCAGPGRVCQALGITDEHSGMQIDSPPFQLLSPAFTEQSSIVTGPRIGISKAKDAPWRFGLSGSPFLSRPFR